MALYVTLLLCTQDLRTGSDRYQKEQERVLSCWGGGGRPSACEEAAEEGHVHIDFPPGPGLLCL